MKRVHVDSGIYIRISDSGKVSPKCFEVTKKRSFFKLKHAMKLYTPLKDVFQNGVYVWETCNGFMVEFKTYVDSLPEAYEVREKVETVLEGLEND